MGALSFFLSADANGTEPLNVMIRAASFSVEINIPLPLKVVLLVVS